MAKNKKNEQVEEVVEETVEVEESTADDLFTSEVTETIKVKLLKNIKHNQTRYKAGDEIELTEEELGHFKNLRLVKDDQQ